MNFIIGAFKPACIASITFSDGKSRKQVPLKKDNGQTIMVPLFQSQETIAGKISVEPIAGKKVEHNGIKVELLGQIEMYFDRGNFYDFTSLGEYITFSLYMLGCMILFLDQKDFCACFRYILKVTVSRGYAGSIVEYQDFVVWNYTPPPPINNSIKMEVGIEDCLHIEFEYNKGKYHLKDVIVGK
ncbi:vacuolar protein sorting-associated protein 26A-like, partial [Olea europaea var. sylvestris]|uniref:vacuolar protein sorting-associated protein 26A-like n=1 Tax=Olea europaea var. sylvestris TaxID=158386 RepID=UPI000C1D7996